MTVDLGFRGRALNAITIDYTVLLSFDGGCEVRVESEFALYDAGVWQQITPGLDLGALGDRLQALTGTVVQAASAAESGLLLIEFGDDAVLRVEPDENYEAWSFAGPDGDKVICLPGGELAVWAGQSGS
ncbi:DUF6188 family protein [Crossiella sp. CA198]|uniref:DUF6188 family protein n=1 Tax=Crossiella sp. CA198 TaxID=3455607 RepID=UPI003F8D7294